jgi:hypothetical protein
MFGPEGLRFTFALAILRSIFAPYVRPCTFGPAGLLAVERSA